MPKPSRPRRPNPERSKPSANGYVLEVTTRLGNKFELVASWAAPYFVFSNNDGAVDAKGRELEPMLYHAETLADARRVARYGGEIFDADFTKHRD